jgi:2-octaprenylphenol hydroxylase
MSQDFDVVIAGGGLVGSALALMLAEVARVPAARIALLEPHPSSPPAPGSPIGLRVSNISPVNRQRLTQLGAWQRLDATRIAPVQSMAIWHESIPPDSPDTLRFDAAENHAPELGVIVENLALQAALQAACRDAGMVMIEERLGGIDVQAGGVEVSLRSGGGPLRAELLVGADGAASTVRGMLGLPAGTRDYGQRAIVGTIDVSRPHQGTAFQRFLSTGPLALLPLPGRQCSIVWSATEPLAAELLALSPQEFSARLTEASAGVLGTLELAGERGAFPLRRLNATRYVAPRAALVGDAAHVIHPLAGQGVNQGFEDAAALAVALAQRPARESLGAAAALRRYERERRAGNALVGGVVDGLDALFTGAPAPVSWAARTGMAVVARSAALRRLLVTQAATGRSLPRR